MRLEIKYLSEPLRPATQLDDSNRVAQLPLRFVTLLEIISVVGSVLLVIWGIAPLFPQARWAMAPPAILALTLAAYSFYLRGERLSDLGLSHRYCLRTIKLLFLPTALACTVSLLLGYFAHSFHRSTHFELNLLIVPLWGVAQQVVLQGFIYRRIRQLLIATQLEADVQDQRRKSNWAVLATASIFGFVHLPNPTLTVLTFLATLLWSWVYERAPNLWVLGFCHGALSLLLMHTCPPWLLPSMSVGYKHFLYQKF